MWKRNPAILLHLSNSFAGCPGLTKQDSHQPSPLTATQSSPDNRVAQDLYLLSCPCILQRAGPRACREPCSHLWAHASHWATWTAIQPSLAPRGAARDLPINSFGPLFPSAVGWMLPSHHISQGLSRELAPDAIGSAMDSSPRCSSLSWVLAPREARWRRIEPTQVGRYETRERSHGR